MLRRITSIWPNLLGRPAQGEDGENHNELRDEDEMLELQLETLKVYGNESWTRLIALHGFLPG